MVESAHREVIQSVTELCTLLDTLSVFPAGVIYPQNPKHKINEDAARAAGYADEAINVMCALPYFDIKWTERDTDWQILPSTYPITYLGENEDQGSFEQRREMIDDELMPASALRLTSSALYGVEFIYDTENKLMVAWEPLENPDDTDGYDHVPKKRPSESLRPMIEDYRRLNYIGGASIGIDFNYDFFSESGGEAPEDFSEREKRIWRAQYDVWAATRKIKDFYLECGWNVDTVEQSEFRREDFLEKRRHYLRDVLEPLIERSGNME
ncbi:hypothetical protein MBLNU459_g8012t1 [Dothideomycetes sp. NU459]